MSRYGFSIIHISQNQEPLWVSKTPQTLFYREAEDTNILYSWNFTNTAVFCWKCKWRTSFFCPCVVFMCKRFWWDVFSVCWSVLKCISERWIDALSFLHIFTVVVFYLRFEYCSRGIMELTVEHHILVFERYECSQDASLMAWIKASVPLMRITDDKWLSIDWCYRDSKGLRSFISVIWGFYIVCETEKKLLSAPHLHIITES